jgi:hypothetical protein
MAAPPRVELSGSSRFCARRPLDMAPCSACTITFAAYVAEARGTAVKWDKTVKTGRLARDERLEAP